MKKNLGWTAGALGSAVGPFFARKWEECPKWGAGTLCFY
jgi:hypothetical protein